MSELMWPVQLNFYSAGQGNKVQLSEFSVFFVHENHYSCDII